MGGLAPRTGGQPRAVSTTETEASPALTTYARSPSGATATASGQSPTGTVSRTRFAVVSMTDRVFESLLVT
jgi:hypothetical protein